MKPINCTASSNLMMRALAAQQQKRAGLRHRKSYVFRVTLSLDERDNPRFLKMQVIPSLKQSSVKKFANSVFTDGSETRSDGDRSYIPALEGYTHELKTYDPNSGLHH